jgi:hypothetical protein
MIIASTRASASPSNGRVPGLVPARMQRTPRQLVWPDPVPASRHR